MGAFDGDVNRVRLGSDIVFVSVTRTELAAVEVEELLSQKTACLAVGFGEGDSACSATCVQDWLGNVGVLN
jgi:hypothetical protein